MNKHILYFTFQGLESDSGYAIQFFSEARHLLGMGYAVTVLSFPDRAFLRANPERFREVEKRVKAWGGRVVTIPVSGWYRPWLRRLLSPRLARLIRGVTEKYSVDLVHAHGLVAGYLTEKALRKSNLPFVLDLHGAVFAETVFETNRDFVKSREMCEQRCLKQRALNRADRVFVVSRYFRRYLEDTYFVPAGKIVITPSSAEVPDIPGEEKRTAERREHGWENKFVLVYSGSLHKWQKVDEILRFAGELAAVLPEFHFLMITRNREQATAMLQEHFAKEEFTVLSLPSDKVAHYLALGDLGIILREDNLVNRVASPIKLKEYLMAGLPIVVSSNIGDDSAFIERHQLGWVVRQLETDEYRRVAGEISAAVTAGSFPDRNKCREKAVAGFSWPVTMEIFRQQYSLLVDK